MKMFDPEIISIFQSRGEGFFNIWLEVLKNFGPQKWGLPELHPPWGWVGGSGPPPPVQNRPLWHPSEKEVLVLGWIQ